MWSRCIIIHTAINTLMITSALPNCHFKVLEVAVITKMLEGDIGDFDGHAILELDLECIGARRT